MTLFVLNLLQASLMDLSHDEAYYWIYSLSPDWGYYDHPPMVAWLIALFGSIGKNELLVRLPFALLQAGAIWMLWDMAEKKRPWLFIFAALSFPLLLGSGFLALPDTPVLFFSILFWWSCQKYLRKDGLMQSALVALAVTGMFYSKYHSIVIVLLTVAAVPEVLKKKSFYGIVLACFALYLPHVYWQWDHQFVSIMFHLTGRSEKHFDLANIGNFVGGQVALGGILAFLPALYFAWRGRRKNRILSFNSLGFMGFIFLLSFRNKIEANWTVTAFAAMVPLLCLSVEEKKKEKILLVLFAPSVLLILGLRVALMLPYDEGNYPTARLAEVKNWNKKAQKAYQAAAPYPLVADTYQLASKLSFYGDQFVPSLALGSRKSQFSLMQGMYRIENDDKLSYIGDEKSEGAVIIQDAYNGPFYLIKGALLEEIKTIYK